MSVAARRPDFLIVGAARSGTTALVEGLRANGTVFVTEPKEPHFLALHGPRRPCFTGPGDDVTINREAVTELTQYLALFEPSAQASVRGEASVSTLYYVERSVPAIQRVCPEARIVILLREPVSRSFSGHQYMTARGFETLDFEAGVAAEPERLAQNWHHQWHYTGLSRYAPAVEAFLTAFGTAQVGIWYFDDLQTDYVRTVVEVLRFIGAPRTTHEAEPSLARVNVSGTPRSRLGHRVLTGLTAHPQARHAVKRLLPYRTRELARRSLLRPARLDDAVRAQLAPLFAEDLHELSTLVGRAFDRRDLPEWLS